MLVRHVNFLLFTQPIAPLSLFVILNHHKVVILENKALILMT